MLDDVLGQWRAKEVSALSVYTNIFHLGDGVIQRSGEYSDGSSYKANPIGYWKNDGESKGHYRVMLDDTFSSVLAEMQSADFSLMNCITYFGRERKQEHASKMYAMVFDLDGCTDITLSNLLSGCFKADAYPVPTYIILSGHNVHLYYVFEEAVSLYPNLRIQLKELKYALTEKIWNEYTSKSKHKQMQGIFQAFRVIGGKTKKDAPEERVRAFLVWDHPYTLEKLSSYVDEKYRVDESKLFPESRMTLEEAHEKYPSWYEKVILHKDKSRKKWDIQGKVHGDDPQALYHWWLRQIRSGATYGHRYFCIMCLAIYAIKNDVDKNQLEDDAYSLVPFLDALNPSEPFTREDVKSALECYDGRYFTFPREDISKLSGIPIALNKRNGRKQRVHLRIARQTLDILNDENGKALQGRKNKKRVVAEWQHEHPDGIKAECIRDTGLSRKTVAKWWIKDD